MTAISDLDTVQVPLADLKEHPRNAREGNVPKIMESLEMHGQYRALVVQRSTMFVCAGNHTLQAMRRLDWPTAACHVLDLTDEQAMRILLVDNRSSDEATYDYEALADVLDELQTSGQGLDGTGYEPVDLDDLLAKLDEVTTGDDDDDNVETRRGLSDKKVLYDQSTVRAIVLTYVGDQFVWVADRLAQLRDDFDVASNTLALLAVLQDRYPDAPPLPDAE